MQRDYGTKRSRRVIVFVPVCSVFVLFASCLIYLCFKRNVFLVELIIWPNTHTGCQHYELLLKLSLFSLILLFLLVCQPRSNVGRDN